MVIELDGVRLRHFRQVVFLLLAGLGIEVADQVAELPGPPDRAVFGLHRIARALAERRHHPFGERDLVRAGNELGRAPVLGGKFVARYSVSVVASFGAPDRSSMVPISSFQPSWV